MDASDRIPEPRAPDLGPIRPMVRDLDFEQVAVGFTDVVLPRVVGYPGRSVGASIHPGSRSLRPGG